MRYRHGMSNTKRDWVMIILLYSMIGWMCLSAYLYVDNYVYRGKLDQCRESRSEN